MEPDKYQQAWQAHASATRVSVDADLLLKIVQRDQQEMRAAISWGDYVTIAMELLLVPAWIYMGVTKGSPWTWYLMVPACFWVIGFTVAMRLRDRPTPKKPGEPLLSSVRESLALVERQIWSSRNIFWWYLLPVAMAMLTYTAHSAWLRAGDWLDALLSENAFLFLAFLALFYFIYYVSQRVVRTQYEPRRQELLALLASLGDEATGEVSGEYPLLMKKRVAYFRLRLFVGGACFLAIVAIVLAGMVILVSRQHPVIPVPRQYHPEKSPFAAVRWQEAEPQVQVGQEWFKLVSLDSLSADEIVAFSRRTYGDKWQKRFEEDLVELLTQMGHPPQDTVTLKVQSLTTSETRTLKDVPMTSANRQAIWDAARKREGGEEP